MKILIERPKSDIPDIYQPYMILVPDDGLLTRHLEAIMNESEELLSKLSDETLTFRYQPGKWTIKDIIQHLCDSERVYVYRAMRIARNDKTEMPGFDEKMFAVTAQGSSRTISDLLSELRLQRTATIAFISSLSDEALDRKAMANSYLLSARLIVNQIYAHHRHHLNVINERYLKKN